MANILIVEDDESLLAVIGATLSAAGHETRLAADGVQAQRALDRFPADLILTDLVMPEKEGLALLMELKHRPQPIPVIAMSGAGGALSGEYLRYAQMLGASATLAKPFKMDVLLSAVGKVLAGDGGSRFRSEREGESKSVRGSGVDGP